MRLDSNKFVAEPCLMQWPRTNTGASTLAILLLPGRLLLRPCASVGNSILYVNSSVCIHLYTSLNRAGFLVKSIRWGRFNCIRHINDMTFKILPFLRCWFSVFPSMRYLWQDHKTLIAQWRLQSSSFLAERSSDCLRRYLTFPLVCLSDASFLNVFFFNTTSERITIVGGCKWLRHLIRGQQRCGRTQSLPFCKRRIRWPFECPHSDSPFSFVSGGRGRQLISILLQKYLGNRGIF